MQPQPQTLDYSIELRNLSTGYKSKKGDTVISNNINAKLRTSQLTCLLGPNGAGKSTLLRTLSNFQKPLGGIVELMGKDVATYTPSDLSQLISVVLTDNSGIRNMTAYEVVGMGRSPYTGFFGRLRAADRHIIDLCFKWVEIEDLKERKMQTLSDGERQKVMIAKAIAQETPIIFLDEPTAFLDYPSKIQMMLLLRRLAHSLNKTIFLSTHDLEHALQLSDQIWLLDKENGLTTGTVSTLSQDGSIERYFNREGIRFNPELRIFQIDKQN